MMKKTFHAGNYIMVLYNTMSENKIPDMNKNLKISQIQDLVVLK